MLLNCLGSTFVENQLTINPRANCGFSGLRSACRASCQHVPSRYSCGFTRALKRGSDRPPRSSPSKPFRLLWVPFSVDSRGHLETFLSSLRIYFTIYCKTGLLATHSLTLLTSGNDFLPPSLRVTVLLGSGLTFLSFSTWNVSFHRLALAPLILIRSRPLIAPPVAPVCGGCLSLAAFVIFCVVVTTRLP